MGFEKQSAVKTKRNFRGRQFTLAVKIIRIWKDVSLCQRQSKKNRRSQSTSAVKSSRIWKNISLHQLLKQKQNSGGLNSRKRKIIVFQQILTDVGRKH